MGKWIVKELRPQPSGLNPEVPNQGFPGGPMPLEILGGGCTVGEGQAPRPTCIRLLGFGWDYTHPLCPVRLSGAALSSLHRCP